MPRNDAEKNVNRKRSILADDEMIIFILNFKAKTFGMLKTLSYLVNCLQNR